jgi:1-acyl-sn-glycerol-3-phosphate acyltransferase
MDSNTSKFDNLRPIDDKEVNDIIQELLADRGFQNAVSYINPGMSWQEFSAVMSKFTSKYEFQSKIIAPIIWGLAQNTSSDIGSSGWENFENEKSHTFISNHRDIILDAGLLNIIRHRRGLKTTEIAIGDNLFVFPWIEKLVRLNKSFVVRRGVSVRQMLEVSKLLSEYIHHTITQKNESIWIAQREGRAKDSDDRTQESLLKMLALAPEKTPIVKALRELCIVPLAISYEYDPCDFLKAQEFQLKRDDPNYKKTQANDLKNMETGLLGFKGKIHFRFGNPINDFLDSLDPSFEKQEVLQRIASYIDKQIHYNYEIYPGNYIAYDLANETSRFADKYTLDEKEKFKRYVDGQIEKIQIENKDHDFLQKKMIEMYSNILKNYSLAHEEDQSNHAK